MVSHAMRRETEKCQLFDVWKKKQQQKQNHFIWIETAELWILNLFCVQFGLWTLWLEDKVRWDSDFVAEFSFSGTTKRYYCLLLLTGTSQIQKLSRHNSIACKQQHHQKTELHKIYPKQMLNDAIERFDLNEVIIRKSLKKTEKKIAAIEWSN